MLITASNVAAGKCAMLAWNWTGPWEIVIILLAILLLFGARKLPEMARGLARGLRTFKDEMKGIRTDENEGEDDKKPSSGEKANELPGSDDADSGKS